MGSRSFRFIKSDGSWPAMTVGGNITEYQRCLLQFKDAWNLIDQSSQEEAANSQRGDLGLESILEEIQTAYLRGRWSGSSAQVTE